MDDSTASGQMIAWVRRPWCVWLAVGLVLLGAVLNIIYLFNHCPIDLSEDESHYWEWSRHLDYGYYSKPPGIAWVIAAAVRVGGVLGLNGDGSGAALMPVIRMPAIFFGILSGLLSWALARRMFRDDRVGLAVILLSAAVPMFAVGSLLITIDSPMYLCWAGTVYCLWRVVECANKVPNSKLGTQSSKLAWLYGAGLAAAAGMLFKPVLIAIPIFVAIAAWKDGAIRRAFNTKHSLGALLVMMLSQVPVVIWNSQHDWVTFRHILTQGGLGKQAGDAVTRSAAQKFLLDPLVRLGSYVGGQAGGMGGLIFFLLLLAVIVAMRHMRAARKTPQSDPPSETSWAATRWTFLLSFFVPLWGFYFILNLWKGTEPNWPAAGYFTGMILLAGVVVQQWNSALPKIRRDWRGWTTASVILGVILTVIAMNLHRFYPLAREKLTPLAGTDAYGKSPWNPRKWDITAGKLRGMQARADMVDRYLKTWILAPDAGKPLIVTGRYDTSSSLAFYMSGHPFVYCLMSSLGGRQSQYDLWPGLNQKDAAGNLAFKGRPALIVGLSGREIDALIRPAFDRVEGPETLPVSYDGIVLKEVVVYRAWSFKGMPEVKGEIF